MSYVMTAAGEGELKRILTKYGREHDDLMAWVIYRDQHDQHVQRLLQSAERVDNALGNLYEGESLEVELTGLREPTGQTVSVLFEAGHVEPVPYEDGDE